MLKPRRGGGIGCRAGYVAPPGLVNLKWVPNRGLAPTALFLRPFGAKTMPLWGGQVPGAE